MTWQFALWPWLVHSAVFGAVVLGAGVVGARVCRQPVYRIAFIGWSFVGCLFVPVVQISGLLPQREMRVLPASASGPFIAVEVERRGIAKVSTRSDDPATGAAEFRQLAVAHLDDMSAAGPSPAMDAADFATEISSSSSDSGVSATSPVAGAYPLWMKTIAWAYAVILGGLLLRGGVGAINLHRLQQGARAVSAGVAEQFRLIAGPQGRNTRLLMSDDIQSPVTWGLIRPVIVLPASLAGEPASPRLQWSLAHEWSHIRRRDVVLLWAAGLAKLFCFYQPAYWWLRRQLLLSQDFLADAFASQQTGSSEDYAEFLVSLARSRMQPACAGALGIADRPSNLFRRVSALLESSRPLAQSLRRGPAVAISVGSIAALAALCIFRLDAVASVNQAAESGKSAIAQKDAAEKVGDQHAVAEKPAEEQEEKPAEQPAEKPLPDPITYSGRVVNRITGEPIGGVRVEIIRSLNRDPKTGEWKNLETTFHETNAAGEYSFTLPPEQVAEGSLYLEVDAHHPDYLSKGRSGYAHSMILKNIKLGEPPFYSLIKLSPGKRISGVVQSPDGRPLADVPILGYSKAPSDKPGLSFERGAFIKARSDEAGRFELTVATPGGGVFWLFPDEYSPQAHVIPRERGDMGTFTAVDGPRLSGAVLNALGEPVPNVWVNARRRGDGEDVDQFLGQNAVANQIGRSALTDDEGHFEFGPLPGGEYRLEVSERSQDPSRWGDRETVPVEDVFARMTVTLKEGEIPPPIEYRASPHVIIRGRFFNSKGEPRSSHEQLLWGKANGESFFTESTRPLKDGWFEFKVPHGIREVELHLMTNEHGALRWRTSPGEELQYGREIDLGTVEGDIDGIEIVRYTAPILLIHAVDEAGEPVDGFKPMLTYTQDPAGGRRTRFTNGGDVNCEHQPDGRWRTSQLLPDEEVTVKVEKEGFVSDPQTLTIPEAETRELTFTLRKAD